MHPLLTLVWFLRSLVVILLWELISSGSFQEAVTAFRLPLCLPYFSQCLALTGHSKKKCKIDQNSAVCVRLHFLLPVGDYMCLLLSTLQICWSVKDLPHTLNTRHV